MALSAAKRSIIDIIEAQQGTPASNAAFTLLQWDISAYEGYNWGNTGRKCRFIGFLSLASMATSGMAEDGAHDRVTFTRTNAANATGLSTQNYGGTATQFTISLVGNVFTVQTQVLSTLQTYLVMAHLRGIIVEDIAP